MYYVDGQITDLRLYVDSESVTICINRGDDKDPIHIAYWNCEEVEEDPSLAFTIANATQLFYTDPKLLLKTLGIKFKSEQIKEYINKLG